MISVIIPFRNRFDLVDRCVKSVLNQSFSDFEIILIDDDSREIYRNNFQDNRIKLHRNEVNLGPGGSRNRGIEIACGNYIAFLDSDDFWANDFLKRTSEKLGKDSKNVFCYSYTYNMIDGEVKGLRKNNDIPYHNIAPTIFVDGRPWCTSACLWNADYIKGRISFQNLRSWEDYLFDFSAAVQSNHIACVAEPLCYYDISADEKLSNDPQTQPDTLISTTRISRLLRTSDLKNQPDLVQAFIKCYSFIISSRVSNNTPPQFFEALKELYFWTRKSYLHPVFSKIFLSRSRKLRTHYIRRKLLGIPHPNKSSS